MKCKCIHYLYNYVQRGVKHHKVLIKHNNNYTYNSTYFKHYRLQLHNYNKFLLHFMGNRAITMIVFQCIYIYNILCIIMYIYTCMLVSSCWHNLENNRWIKALRIMLAYQGRISQFLSNSYNTPRRAVSDLQSPIPRVRSARGEVTVNQTLPNQACYK